MAQIAGATVSRRRVRNKFHDRSMSVSTAGRRVGTFVVRTAIGCVLAVLVLVLLEAWWPSLVDPVFAWWSA